MTRRTTSSGFTLIELSIVLVIIGLIVGGVLVGQDLIKAAQLRAVISEIEKFNTAANTFSGKYGCLPGDCTNAGTLLGDHIQGGWPYDKNGNIIWNGNGNGTIDGTAGYQPLPGQNNGNLNSFEPWGFWHHLYIGGLITSAGTTPGQEALGATSFTDSVVGTNIPVSALGGSTGYVVSGADPIGGLPGGDLYDWVTGNVFILGTQDTVTNNANYDINQLAGPWLPALTAAAAKNIDSKIDDGQPTTGSVTTFTPTGHYNPTCVSGTAYNITSSSALQCTMVFKAQF